MVRSHRNLVPSRPLLSAAGLLALAWLAGCNLVLNNEERRLAVQAEDSGAPSDASSDASFDASAEAGGAPDAGPDASAGCPPAEARECSPPEIDRDSEPCGRCGLGARERERSCSMDCTWGVFGEWSECSVPDDVCTPGEEQEMTKPCGPCDAGIEVSRRTCSDECSWTEWSAEACSLPDDRCAPGESEQLDPRSCDSMCGTAAQTRTCNAECRWDEPIAGECSGQGECMPGEIRMSSGGCNASFCNKGVQEQMETCNASCGWDAPVPVGACEIPTGVCRPADLGGRGWRCRPNDPGFRETCTPSTASEAERCTWSGTRERFNQC